MYVFCGFVQSSNEIFQNYFVTLQADAYRK